MTEAWEQVRQHVNREKQLEGEVSALMLLWKGLLTTESCPTSTELLEWRLKSSYRVMTKAINWTHEWCRTHRSLTHQQIARTAYVYIVNRTNQERTKWLKTTKS
jgi:hypothetical protein